MSKNIASNQMAKHLGYSIWENSGLDIFGAFLLFTSTTRATGNLCARHCHCWLPRRY